MTRLSSTAHALWLAIAASSLISCSGGVEGRFVNSRDPAEFVEFDGNGNWSMVQELMGMHLPKGGNYTDEGHRVILRIGREFGNDVMHEATLRGDTLIWSSPTMGRWVRK